MPNKIITSALFFNLFITSILNATIINVPGDQSTIQAGIDASINSDTIVIYTSQTELSMRTYSYDSGARIATFDPAMDFKVKEVID